MPSIEAPSHYERAHGIATSLADNFFKWLDLDEFEEYTGTVEAPTGWVGLIKVTPFVLATYAASFGDDNLRKPDVFTPGWYIVKIDGDGIVHAMSYGGWCSIHEAFDADTLNEEHARADYAEARDVYAQWDMLNYGMFDGVEEEV